MTRSIATTLTVLALAACGSTAEGDPKTPDYWADHYLDKYADDLTLPAELEPGPEPLAEPRTVLLITGVTIRAEWFDPIAARLERDGFRPVVYEPPALLSGDLYEASEDLADVDRHPRRVHGGRDRPPLHPVTGR
jgi:hypothetical protein